MSEIKITNDLGKPALMIDGKIVPSVIYGLSDFPAAASNTAYAQRNIALFKESGVNLINIDSEIAIGWHKVTPYECDPILAEIENVLDANPDAKVFLRLHMNAPYWWMRDNSDECVIYRTAAGDVPGIDDGGHDRLITHDEKPHLRASFASKKWLKDTSEKLELLCDAIEAAPFGKALIGIQIACGMYGEWHAWGDRWNTDVSKPMKERFKELLRDKYGSDEALQAAWHDTDVTIETAEYHPELEYGRDDGFFRDPQISQNAIDARECVQAAPADAILHFAKVIKTKLPRMLTGAFYGYALGTGGDHLQVDRIHASGLLDFHCAPFCYLENRDYRGVPMHRGLLESHRLRGKLWLTEMDQHPEGSDLMGFGNPDKFPITISVLRRNTIWPLLAGQGYWYYDHRVIPKYSSATCATSVYRKRGWWEDKPLQDEIAKVQRLAEEICAKPYKAASDVLIVYDNASYYHRPLSETNLEYRIHEAIARCGVSYDCIYTHELEIAELDRYKCVIFANAYYISPENREKYRSLLKDKVTLWLSCEGYSDGRTLSADNVSDTVGISVVKTEKCDTLEIRETEISNAYGVIKTSSETVCAEKCAAPLFSATLSDGASAFAYWSDGKVAGAIKGNDIWYGLPLITRGLMKSVFEFAGAHIYCDSGDPIMANADYLVINCVSGGERTLKFKNGNAVNVTLPEFTTAIFSTLNGQRIL